MAVARCHTTITRPQGQQRGAARLAAVQALYQMDIAGTGVEDIFAEFESHWLGSEVEGESIFRPRPRSSATSLTAWCASSASSIR